MSGSAVSLNTPEGPSRRERLRAETVAEIKASARRQLLEKGYKAISLRAVAREVGMSPAALYRYFDSLDDLVVELCCDFWDELIAATVEAMETVLADRHLERMKCWVWTFRSWSVAHRSEFELMFNAGEGMPQQPEFSYAQTAPEEIGPTAVKAMEHARLCATEFALFWRHTQRLGLADELTQGNWLPPMSDALVEEVRCCNAYLGTPTEMPFNWTYRFMSAWVRVFGMIVMETFGALPVKENVDEFYKAEVTSMIAEILGEHFERLSKEA
jgi:AcrR family transcriptional regulator